MACVRVTDIVVVYPHISDQIVGAHTQSVVLTEIEFGHNFSLSLGALP